MLECTYYVAIHVKLQLRHQAFLTYQYNCGEIYIDVIIGSYMQQYRKIKDVVLRNTCTRPFNADDNTNANSMDKLADYKVFIL